MKCLARVIVKSSRFLLACLITCVPLLAPAQEPPAAETATDEKPTTYFDLRQSKDLLSRQIADRYFNLVKLQEWTSDKGSKINAKYVSHADDLTSVTLAVARGTGAARVMKEVTVPTNRLNKTCQSRVKQIDTLQKRLDDLLAKAAAEPADPAAPGYVAPDPGAPMLDDRGQQPPPRRVRQRSQTAATQQPAAAPPSAPTVSPSADDGSVDPLGFGELPAAPAAALPAGLAQPPTAGVPSPPPEAFPPAAEPPGVSAAPPSNDDEAWRTSYDAFRANFNITSGERGVDVDWGELEELRDVGKGIPAEFENRKEPAPAVVALDLPEVQWEAIYTGLPSNGPQGVITFDVLPLPPPLRIEFRLSDPTGQLGGAEESKVLNDNVGKRLRFQGKLAMSSPKTIVVLVSKPEVLPDDPNQAARGQQR
jgi:hypothetical protein